MLAYYTGTFVSAMGGTFDSDIPGTFESATGGTFNPLLSPDRRQRDNKKTPGNTPSLKPHNHKKGD